MKGSVIVLTCFAAALLAGVLAGHSFAWMDDASMWLLYLLMLLVGLGVGADPDLPDMLRRLTLRDFAYPVVTIAGTLFLTLLASPLVTGVSLGDCLAINSACGYYSLSSILIPQLKSPETGASAIAEIGAVALLANIVRELLTLVFAPAIARIFGPRALISAAGVTSVDVCLPAIRRCCGDAYTAPAILHGTVIDLAVPWMIALLAA